MPRIPPAVINAVFYLYNSKDDAAAGRPFGGTGFFVGMPSGIKDYTYSYAVTNWHVACRDGASVVRVNKFGGGVDIFEFDPSEWLFRPDGYDIALLPIKLDSHRHDVVMLSPDMFLSRESIARLNIGPGDDVFMIGRFVDHDGAGTNTPAARFGNISVIPQSIPQPNNSIQPSFILDVHSRTGYSGSPVFVYRTIASDLTPNRDLILSPNVQFLQLLGIHWGQFPERWEIEREVRSRRSKTKVKIESPEGVVLSGDASYIKGLSGMTMAAPAWAIQDLLDTPSLKQIREHDSEIIRRRRASSSASPTSAENSTRGGAR